MTSRAARFGEPESLSYVRLASPFGSLGIFWRQTASLPQVLYISLPNEGFPPQGAPRATFSQVVARTCPDIAVLGEQLQRYLEGEPVTFDLNLVALGMCGEFQRRVLLAEHGIPRGCVSTYGRVACVVGSPGGARAVGQALARNPFPLVIPCHRAVRSDGRLGGYRGGLDMKRALLQLEGVEVTPSGRVVVDRFYTFPIRG